MEHNRKEKQAATGSETRDSLIMDVNATKKTEVSSQTTKDTKASLMELFQFATARDKLLILIASVAAIINGLSQPSLFLVFSDVIGMFATYQLDLIKEPLLAGPRLQDKANTICIICVFFGVGTFVSAYLQQSLWSVVGERQAVQIRNRYYKSVLSQNIGWFDSVSSGDVATRLAGDVSKVQEGISDRIGLLLQYFSTFVGGFVIALYKGWELTLVLLCAIPLLAGSGLLFTRVMAHFTKGSMGAYNTAGTIAAEVLAAIRTVYSFDAVEREVERYTKAINEVRVRNLKRELINGVAVGFAMAVVFLIDALAMWYGGKLIVEGKYDPQSVIVVFFNVLIGSMTLGQTSPNISAIIDAQVSGARIFSVIYRESSINPFTLTERMEKAQSAMVPVRGNIEFKNVTFAYPNRLEKAVLNKVSFTVTSGQTVALVGPSGSGKSTAIGLLERFYDPEFGSISIDGVDIADISTPFLRDNIGLVGQEPTLFATSIKENLLFGLPGCYDTLKAQEMVENACKLANIHEFIMELPKGYDTTVGEMGNQLSGGQKQRIAIARAIVKNPPILLLDEATSALDTESESTVQKALDAASNNRTTLVIAHRLSTIQHADKILVFDKGEIVESGSHKELISVGGIYADMVVKQSIRSEAEQSALTKGFNELPTSTRCNAKYSRGRSKDLMTTSAPTSFESSNRNNAELVKKQKNVFTRLLKISKSHVWLLIFGTLGAVLEGAVFPLYALILTRVNNSLIDAMTPGLEEQGKSNINFWALMFVVLAINSFIAGTLKVGLLSQLGEHVTFEVRRLSFIAMTKQEIAYFDDPDNGLSALTARLSTEADQVKNLITKVYAAVMSAVTCVGVGLALAFFAGWKLTLVILACSPLVAFSRVSDLAAQSSDNSKTKKIYQQVTQVAMESVIQIRTLAYLSKEAFFYNRYLEQVAIAHKASLREYFGGALSYGIALSSPNLVTSLVLWYGTTLVVSREYNYQDMFQIVTSVIFMGVSIGFLSAEMSSLAKSKKAAINVFDLWDRIPKIDASSDYGTKSCNFEGNVVLENGYFAYPSRPDVPILQGLNLSVLANKKVALVGASGSGKSTVIALLQRFYSLDSGKMYTEGRDITKVNVPHIRSTMAVVGQEPVLFNISIEDNIRYGALEPNKVSSSDIVRVAKLANAHDFISLFPDGYRTNVGERGGQMSGGQKQRIAIARALIRNPKVLLLDEATSALDSQSESIVQAALDKASEDRTTITIAHRLATIQDCDCIIAVRHGKVVEIGTHNELLLQKGYYYSLVNSQTL